MNKEKLAKMRLLNAITKPTLWKNIKEFMSSVYEYDWEIMEKPLNVTSFVSKYYPEDFVNPDTFRMLQEIFSFLKEYYKEYREMYAPNGEDDSDDTTRVFSDAVEYFEEKEKNEGVEWFNQDRNPLYEGEEGFVTRDGDYKLEIKPKQSLFETMVEPHESTSLSFLDEDFKYKADMLKRALKGDDKKYNEKILAEFYEICKALIDDKYYWRGELCTLKEIVEKELPIWKTYPERILNESVQAKANTVRRTIWESAICIYEHYQRTQNPEVYIFFLKAAIIAVYKEHESLKEEVIFPEDVCLDKWKELSVFNEKMLEEIFVEDYERLYQNIKAENGRIIDSISEKIKGKEDVIFKNGVPDVIEFKPAYKALRPIEVLNYTFHCFPVFYNYILPESDAFALPSNDFYKKWLLDFIECLGEKADEHFKGNAFYARLMFNREGIADDSDVDYSNILTDFDFSKIKKELDLYYLDDFVKSGYWQIIQNKEKLASLYAVYRIFKNDNDIDYYICKEGYAVSNSLDNRIFDDLSVIINFNMKGVKTPEELARYIEKQKEMIKNLTVLQKPYEFFFEQEMKKIEKIVSDWNTDDRQRTHERLCDLKRVCSDEVFTEVEKILATSETLYHVYVKAEIKLDDYSVVAINYYRALEYLLNQLFYIPYKEEVLDKIINEKEKRKKKLKYKDLEGYCGDSFGQIYPAKNTLMLGQLSRFFDFKEDGSDKYLIEFLKKKGVNTDKLKAYAQQLGKIVELRNECAHPKIIEKATAVRGRIVIYLNENNEDAEDETRANELFEMLINIKDLFEK